MILSSALDTNGQNARYVRAAEKWGSDPDVLKIMAIGNSDPAGVVGRFQIAAEKFQTGVTIRSAHKAEAYFQFPRDLLWTRHTDHIVRELAEQADVIHLNNSWRAYARLNLRRKPALLHHHGSLFRNNSADMLRTAKQYGMVQAVSTVDLMQPAPDVLHWLPTAYDVDELQAFGEQHRREADRRIRVVSAPTNRDYKSTAALELAIKALQAEGLPVDLVLVEGKPWAECMAIKATADIYFDQVILGYGCNAVEAWGMGIPVIAGAQPWTLNKMTELWGGLPFYSATEDTIADAIRDLVQSADLRAEYAAKGMAHVRTYHDEKPALERLVELYMETVKGDTKRREVIPAVTFESTRLKPILVNGIQVQFSDGRVTTTDPDVIARLRYFCTRPAYGMRELSQPEGAVA
jgi:hypothetical protein